MRVIKGQFSGSLVSTKTGNICICSAKESSGKNHDIYLLDEDIISYHEISDKILKPSTFKEAVFKSLATQVSEWIGGVGGAISAANRLKEYDQYYHIVELELTRGSVLFILCENDEEFVDLMYSAKQSITSETIQAMREEKTQLSDKKEKSNSVIGWIIFIILFLLIIL